MNFLMALLGKLMAVVVDKLIAAQRQRSLEKQAAKAKELEQHLASLKECDAVEDELIKAEADANRAALEVTDRQKKLEAIQAFSRRMKELGK
jgi:hypothetical protein